MSTQPNFFGRSPTVAFERSLSLSNAESNTMVPNIVGSNLIKSQLESRLSSEAGGCAPPRAHQALDEPTANESRALNALIVGLLDHIEERRRAIYAVETRLNSMQRRLYSRVRAVEDLQSYVRRLGAQPAMERSLLAAAVAAKLSCGPYTKDNEKELIEDTDRSENMLRRQIDGYLAPGRLSEAGRSCVHQVLKKMDGDRDQSGAHWSAQSILGADSLRL